jgi:hypothetical protein
MGRLSVLLVAAAIVIGSAIAAAAAVRTAADQHGGRRDPAPRPLLQRRADDIRYGNERLYDIAEETCQSYEIGKLAVRYGVPATPKAVARAFAAGYELSFRDGAYRGCLAAYTEH